MPIKIDPQVVRDAAEKAIDDLMVKIRPEVERAYGDMLLFGRGMILFDHADGIKAVDLNEIGENQ